MGGRHVWKGGMVCAYCALGGVGESIALPPSHPPLPLCTNALIQKHTHTHAHVVIGIRLPNKQKNAPCKPKMTSDPLKEGHCVHAQRSLREHSPSPLPLCSCVFWYCYKCLTSSPNLPNKHRMVVPTLVSLWPPLGESSRQHRSLLL